MAAEYDSIDEESVHGLGAVAVEHFGGLDGWHNNAADTSLEIVMKETMTQERASTVAVRLRRPEDLAAVVSFLLSDDAGFINGRS